MLLELSLRDDIAIIFLARPAEELKRHDEENDTDAGARERSVRSDMP